MKIKTAWLGELRGSIGRPFLGGMSCFRTDKYGNIVGLKSPSEPRVPSGQQRLYRHQLRYWSLHWNFLTPTQKSNYAALGDLEGITGYDYYMKTHYSRDPLHLHPTNNRWVELWKPDRNPTAEEGLHMSDDQNYEDWVYLDFPLDVLFAGPEPSGSFLRVKYAGEAGFSGEGKRVDCHKITEPWKESTITYNTRPSVSGAETDHIDMPAEGTWFEVDVSGDIDDIISTKTLFYGWRLKYHSAVASSESLSSMRSTYPHDDDHWPFVKLIL